MLLASVLLAGCTSNGAPHDGGGDAAGDADAADGDRSDAPVEPCPEEMVLIDDDAGTAFCIDRYEHPGQEGQAPTVGVPWFQARVACAEVGKELCLEEQWTRACAGTPSAACQGTIGVSGRRTACVNELGVRDMPGNVAEWTASPGGSVTFMVRGGSGEVGVIDCQTREELEAEARRVDIGLRCCMRPRRTDP